MLASMALSVAQIDEAIDALALGADSVTLPGGGSIKKTGMADLLRLREIRKAQEDGAEGGIVPQYAEFA